MHPLVAATIGLLGAAALPYVFVGLVYAGTRPSGPPVRKPSINEVSDGSPPSVSVLLPTYNEAAIVERKLEEVAALEYPGRIDVIVADDSTDETPAIVESFVTDRDIDLTLVRGDREGVAAAINRGIDAATSDVIVRTDCDAELATDAIQEAVRTLDVSGIGLVTGRQTAVVGEDSAVEADYRDLLERVQAVETRIDSTFIVHGPCCAFRREDFSTLPRDTIADDTAIGVGIRRGGDRVVMDPSVRFAESGASGLRDRRTRKDRRAAGLLQQLWRSRDCLGRYGRYGAIVLPLNWGLLVGTPWSLLAAILSGTAAAFLAVGATGFALPATIAAVAILGSRERLGPLQPIHAVLDAQLSLLLALPRLLSGSTDGTWTKDRAAREAFE